MTATSGRWVRVAAAGALLLVVLPAVTTTVPAEAATPPPAGTLLVADGSRVVEYRPDGTQQDVPATGLGFVNGVTADAAGNVYISDAGHNRVVKVPGDGSAQTDYVTGIVKPTGLAMDAWGTLYVGDGTNNVLLRVAADGTRTTLDSFPNLPNDVAVTDGNRVDDNGLAYVAMPFSPGDNGAVIEVANHGGEDIIPNLSLNHPWYVTVDAQQRVYATYPGSHVAVSIDENGRGSHPIVYNVNPVGIAVDDATGTVYIANNDNATIATFSPTGARLADVPIIGLSSPTDLALVPAISPPAAAIITPADHNSYDFGSEPDANFTCTASFGATLQAGLAGCSASLDGGPAFASGTPLNDFGGQHTMIVTALDTAGRQTTATSTYVVDTGGQPPDVTINTPVSQTHYFADVVPTLDFTCTAAPGALKPGLDGCWATIDGGPPVASGTPLPNDVRVHDVVAHAEDLNGGSATTSAVYYVDARPPTALLTSPADGATYPADQVPNAAYYCVAGAGSTLRGCGAVLDGRTDIKNGDPLSVGSGTHTLLVVAADDDSQMANAEATFTVVALPPTVQVNTPTEGAVYAPGAVPNADFSCTAGLGGFLDDRAGCTASFDGDPGWLSGAPLPGGLGAHTAVFTATQVDGQTASVTRHYTVSNGNGAPVAADDTLHAMLDAAGSTNVLSNDTDPDGDSLSVSASTNGAHGTASCAAAGTCTYTPQGGYTGHDSFSYTVSDGKGGTDTGAVAVTVGAPAGSVLVSALRFAGPGGTADEYVELANNSGEGLTLAGWRLRWRTASGARSILLKAITLPPGGHLLITGSAYSLLTAGDQTLPSEIPASPGGVRVEAPDGTVTDAIGYASAPGGYREHVGLTPPANTATQYTYRRNEVGGALVDTGRNVRDFTLVTATPGGLAGAERGNPDPDNSSSPTPKNAVLTSSLLDGSVSSSAAPNRRITGSIATHDEQLRVRRTITNSSTDTVTSLRVRLTSIATDGVPGNHAVLALVDSTDGTSGAFSWKGLTVNAASAGAGGAGSWALVPLPPGGLAPGDSVSVELRFAVDAPGAYWFSYDVDAAF